MENLADIVLALHFAVAVFIAFGIILIPIGGRLNWRWIRSWRFRATHAGLMLFVAVEAVLGLTCPLTVIEAKLRQTHAPESFWANKLESLLYWNLSLTFFLVLYLVCAAWVMLLWWFYRPSPNSRIKK